MEAGRFMGYLHPALIHFPIVLLILAVLLDALDFFRPDPRTSWAGRFVLLLGVVSTLFAFVCGNFAEIWAARSGISQDALEYHEFLATITSWSFVALTAWRLLLRNDAARFWRAIWLVLGIGACVMLAFTGHHGAALVYEHGAAVQNIGLQRPPSHDDLLALSQRQDLESIFYSNMMHHIFGWMVLLLSGLLLLGTLAPKIAVKARRIGPLLLFTGGVFLLIFSDQDAWPLYHIRPFRPIYDKEVMLHKTYAVIMLLIGGWGIWKLVVAPLLRRGKSEYEYDYEYDVNGRQLSTQQSTINHQQSTNWRLHSRVMAVFALIGGALLFTHVHSAAPFANVAVGVYFHHTVMGLIALLIGSIKLLDDVLPKPARWRAIAYPAFMCLESVFLINYNEGLPWFMGYRNLSSVAAHGGMVAPMGPHRGELVFSPETQRLELFVMEQESPKPVRLASSYVDAVIRVGDSATVLKLLPNPGGETRSAHFAAKLAFLQGVPTFQARAQIYDNRETYVADFEPWIDPTFLAPHTSAKYICPMHHQIGSNTPGTCPICAMPLQPNRPARPYGVLHDGEYGLDLATVPAAPLPGQAVKMTFVPRLAANGAILTDLATVHTRKLHLIIVSRDLSFFDHVHPEYQADGTLVSSYVFPYSGEYLLYADLTPLNGANQVFRIPIIVRGQVAPCAPLAESLAPAKLLGDYRVELSTAPKTVIDRDEAVLAFRLWEKDRPISDLEPLLGAGGHCVILSEDTLCYLHSHPVEPAGRIGSGPEVQFHSTFPRAGLYKVWGQFRHKGKIITADFVIRVN